ncbi:MAG: metallophosphoesterase family protein [Promethearchaeota archaeon]
MHDGEEVLSDRLKVLHARWHDVRHEVKRVQAALAMTLLRPVSATTRQIIFVTCHFMNLDSTMTIYKVGLISDTHIPSRAPEVPERVLDFFKREGVELILHAGDLTTPRVVAQLERVAPCIAVRGNMDRDEGLRDLPTYAEVTRLGHRIGLTHGWGGPSGFTGRILDGLPPDRPEVVVCGHTHNAFVESAGGVTFVNPGSPTDTKFTSTNTIGVLTISSGEVRPKIVDMGDL